MGGRPREEAEKFVDYSDMANARLVLACSGEAHLVLKDIFEYIGGVPPLLVFDNATGVGRRIFDEVHETDYKKLRPIRELFEEDRKAFLRLSPKSMDIVSYDWYSADGYGKVCIDKKHYYSTRPENHNQKVLVGKRAHYIDIINPDGSVLVRHRREYSDIRTDQSGYSTTIEVLARNSGAWMNSGVRLSLTDPLRDYMDGLERRARKAKIQLLADLNREYGYQAAIKAMDMALASNGEIHRSDARILAERITGYGIDTPPDTGPSLKVYDDAFLPEESRGDAV